MMSITAATRWEEESHTVSTSQETHTHHLHAHRRTHAWGHSDSGVTLHGHMEDSNEDIIPYTEFETGLLVEVDSCYHVSHLLIYIEYAGRVWIGHRIHFIPHQTCRRSLWNEHEWCNKQLVIYVIVAILPVAWNDVNIRASPENWTLQSVSPRP